jgi:hypothetical protein
MLLTEPRGHVKPVDFDAELEAASVAGFKRLEQPPIRGSHTALLKKI